MTQLTNHHGQWMELIAQDLYGNVIERKWVYADDCKARDCWRQHHKGKVLLCSVASYDNPETQKARIAPLYFVIAGDKTNLDEVRESALQICLFLSDYFKMPTDFINLIYDGDAEVVVLISPLVFDNPPTDLMPWINYQIARAVVRNSIRLVNIDSYEKQHYIAMPNSFNPVTSRFSISLTFSELLKINASRLIEVAANPRPEECMVVPLKVQQAVEKVTKIIREAEATQKSQFELQNILLNDGWQTTPCTRHLLWADLDNDAALEACRILSRFYGFIKAHRDEVYQQVLRVAKRNALTNFQQLQSIVRFSVEHPGIDCEHPLLKKFCPDGKCYIRKLMDEYRQPRLFQTDKKGR